MIAERWRHQKDIFDSIAWSTPKSLYQLATKGDRDAGVDMVTNPDERRSKVEMLANIRIESTARLASLPELATFIYERNICAETYLKSIEKRSSATGEPLVIVDARDRR